MKIVLDTNVFVSGLFWSGPPATMHLHLAKQNLIRAICILFRLTNDLLEEINSYCALQDSTKINTLSISNI